jgi:hypothetical protein
MGTGTLGPMALKVRNSATSTSEVVAVQARPPLTGCAVKIVPLGAMPVRMVNGSLAPMARADPRDWRAVRLVLRAELR